jgi:hypothetical protein
MDRSLSGLAATLVDRLFAGNAVVGIVALTLAAAIAVAMVVSKGWYFWRERSLLLKTRRQDLLLRILKSEDLSRVSPARLQIAFARAYGFWLPSVELRSPWCAKTAMNSSRRCAWGGGLSRSNQVRANSSKRAEVSWR